MIVNIYVYYIHFYPNPNKNKGTLPNIENEVKHTADPTKEIVDKNFFL